MVFRVDALVTYRQDNIAPTLFIIWLFTAASCQKSTIKTRSIPCEPRESLYKFHCCYIGCFVSCTCIYYPRLTPPRESLLENMLRVCLLSAYIHQSFDLFEITRARYRGCLCCRCCYYPFLPIFLSAWMLEIWEKNKKY